MIARMAGAEIICMHALVSPPYGEYGNTGAAILPYIEEVKRYSETWYNRVKDIAAKEKVKVSFDTILDIVSAPDSIVNYAIHHNVDLIVIGTTGKTAVKRFSLGSVASGVVTHARSPVLVTK